MMEIIKILLVLLHRRVTTLYSCGNPDINPFYGPERERMLVVFPQNSPMFQLTAVLFSSSHPAKYSSFIIVLIGRKLILLLPIK